MKVGVVGSGDVGQVLADGFIKHGHHVLRASRDPSKLAEWEKSHKSHAKIGLPAAAITYGDVVVLAVKGSAALDLVKTYAKELKGKVVLDTTNPIGGPPVDGVLKFFTNLDQSLMELLQDAAPDARFVKAWSCVGSPAMVNPRFKQGVPTMFICGNDTGAKRTATEILKQFGWGIEDMGGVASARAIEPLCMLWCIRGFQGNGWSHAFSLLTE